ncbi:hypothetical protein IC757_03130 [Wenzhouxiangella sp. AB-CW3]|uniref:hypothetical protein n=1 Tax=Wenzhouxiangella sp. AB-CW3 TaxID=2771012 RepID=UPI00168B74D6|nr:hypothetical protein [Wenzhouxiangella sp. AB-CW3]QOC23168.1 hypothetical protein IC757_03130 [Wenzhouxiangella sp. AB-CW3]
MTNRVRPESSNSLRPGLHGEVVADTTICTYDEFGNELMRTNPLDHTWETAYGIPND